MVAMSYEHPSPRKELCLLPLFISSAPLAHFLYNDNNFFFYSTGWATSPLVKLKFVEDFL